MSNALKAYFLKREKVTITPSSLAKYSKAMDEVIPEIVEDIKKGERDAAELRYSRSTQASAAKRKD